MNDPDQWRPRVLVCGTGFGRTYLSALRRPGMPFELAGILARGSQRSANCARAYQVPLYTDVAALPADLDIACVVVNSAINGGRGAELAQQLMSRGLHVLQEHPLHQTELAACLRQARRSGVMYQVSSHYADVPAVACFIGAARRLTQLQPPLFIDAITSFQVLYTLLDILGQVLGGIRPWSLTGADHGPEDCAGVLRSVDLDLGGIPATLRLQNEADGRQRDNGPHIAHRVTLGTEGGNLLLASTQGPVLWYPRLHMPADYPDAVTVDDSPAAYLDLLSARCLTAPDGPSYREVIGQEWPLAVARGLIRLRAAVLAGDSPLPGGQYHLALSRLAADITARVGRPGTRAGAEPAILEADLAVRGVQPPASSQSRPAAR